MTTESLNESRKEQYLRLLTCKEKNIDKEDYEAARYLIDHGYTDSNILIVQHKIINVIWRGPNSFGLDYIDTLKLEIEKTHQKSQKTTEQKKTGVKEWHENLYGKLILGFFFLALGLIAKFVFL